MRLLPVLLRLLEVAVAAYVYVGWFSIMEVNGYKIEPGANLRDANLAGANLEGADLAGADLDSADLAGANLTKANLANANLYRADLSSACLQNSNLSGADFGQADLTNADLQGANLTKTDFIYAVLNGANLTGTNLDEAICHGMQLLNRQRLPFGKHVTEPYRDGKVLGSADLTGAIMPDGTIFNPVIRTDNWLKHYRDRAQERKSE